nr:hypothetical protein [Aureimonas sp. AU4]
MRHGERRQAHEQGAERRGASPGEQEGEHPEQEGRAQKRRRAGAKVRRKAGQAKEGDALARLAPAVDQREDEREADERRQEHERHGAERYLGRRLALGAQETRERDEHRQREHEGRKRGRDPGQRRAVPVRRQRGEEVRQRLLVQKGGQGDGHQAPRDPFRQMAVPGHLGHVVEPEMNGRQHEKGRQRRAGRALPEKKRQRGCRKVEGKKQAQASRRRARSPTAGRRQMVARPVRQSEAEDQDGGEEEGRGTAEAIRRKADKGEPRRHRQTSVRARRIGGEDERHRRLARPARQARRRSSRRWSSGSAAFRRSPAT